MGLVRTFDHTADVGLRIEGVSLADVFETAAVGLFDVMVANRADIRLREPELVELRAESTAELLLTWLNELIVRCEIQHRFYGRFEVQLHEDELGLNAKIVGEPIDSEYHVFGPEVKAATHHGLLLEPTPSGWVAEVILDL